MIAESWEKIIEWGNRNAPEMLTDLNPGASEEQIAALEVELGQSIPADFRESLLIHNVDILLSLKEEDSLASKQF